MAKDESIELTLTEAQEAVVGAFIREGKLQAFDQLLEIFNKEWFETAPTDPYYGYYVKYVIDKINELKQNI